MSGNQSSPALFALAGISGAFLFSVVWILAVSADTTWTFGINTLSDLGVSSVAIAADLFNFGCISTGLLMMVFGLGKTRSPYPHDSASGVLFMIAGLFLALVGVFPSDNRDIHLFVAYTFFTVATIAIVVSVVGDGKYGRNISAAMGGCIVLIGIASAFFQTIEGLEAICVMCFLAWVVIDSIKLAFSKA